MANSNTIPSHRPARFDEETERIRDIGSYLFWLLLLQGISFVLLGILVIMYPAVLVILVAATFLWIGFTTGLLAWRVRRYFKEMMSTELRHRPA